jgi:hypothetical protein
MSACAHQLFLDIPHTNNPRVFRIFDTSIYCDIIPITCETLQITVPGFNTPYTINVQSNFNLVLNACALGIQSSGCGESSQILPDGIYLIRYSVSPNDKVYVEYTHLRVTQFINKYNQMLCNLEMAACEPDADVKAQLDELRLIKSFIDAAKVKVEDCHENKEGLDLLMYAQKRLMKLDGVKCTNC